MKNFYAQPTRISNLETVLKKKFESIIYDKINTFITTIIGD